jgi:hypothetical protein
MPEERSRADPAPGVFDGHSGWGGKMAIPHMVEEVRHFIAASMNWKFVSLWIVSA